MKRTRFCDGCDGSSSSASASSFRFHLQGRRPAQEASDTDPSVTSPLSSPTVPVGGVDDVASHLEPIFSSPILSASLADPFRGVSVVCPARRVPSDCRSFRRSSPILPASHADPSGDVSGATRPVRPPILPASLADPFSSVARPAADPLVPGSESADDVEVCWCRSLKLFSFPILSPPAHGYRLLGCPFRRFRTRKG